jgi:hypothetical protein
MAWDGTTCTGLRVAEDGADLRVAWQSTSPGPFQAYADGRLVYQGWSTGFAIPLPKSLSWIAVGSIDPTDWGTDFSASIEAPPGQSNRVLLGWEGGAFEGVDIQGWRVYQGTAPGAAAARGTNLVADVPAYMTTATHGYGMGGYGAGGYGWASGNYAWTSGPLDPGTWHWLVTAYDAAGNESAGLAASAAIDGPPATPPPYADGTYLDATFAAGPPPTVTLDWNPSPSF